MAQISFSLKNMLNAYNNPTLDGFFAYGAFNKDTKEFSKLLYYNYTAVYNNDPIQLPFDTNKVLAWHSGYQYPEIGFENLQGNINITPQPFPSFGVYIHPDQRVDGSLAISSKIPLNGTISFTGLIQRSSNCGTSVGYSIYKNKVLNGSRLVIQGLSKVALDSGTIPLSSTDEFYIVIDSGGSTIAEENNICDDTALELLVNINLTKLNTPILLSKNINCETTTIDLETNFVPNGTKVKLYEGNNFIMETTVDTPIYGYKGSATFSPLNLGKYGGKTLTVIITNGIDEDSEPLSIFIKDSGNCYVEPDVTKPIIVQSDICKVNCSYQRTLSGTSSLTKGLVALYEVPIELDSLPIATGIIGGGLFTVSSELISGDKEYSVVAIDYTGEPLLDATISMDDICEKECKLVPKFCGTVNNNINGIVMIFEYPVTVTSIPIASGVVKNGKWEIKNDSFLGGKKYIAYTIELTVK